MHIIYARSRRGVASASHKIIKLKTDAWCHLSSQCLTAPAYTAQPQPPDRGPTQCPNPMYMAPSTPEHAYRHCRLVLVLIIYEMEITKWAKLVNGCVLQHYTWPSAACLAKDLYGSGCIPAGAKAVLVHGLVAISVDRVKRHIREQ